MCGNIHVYRAEKAQRRAGIKAYLHKTHVSEAEKSYNDLDTWKLVKKQGDLVRI